MRESLAEGTLRPHAAGEIVVGMRAHARRDDPALEAGPVGPCVAPPAALALMRLQATAGNAAVAELLAPRQGAPLAVQRTTGKQVEQWLIGKFDPACKHLTDALKPLTTKGDLGDEGLDDRLDVLTREFNGSSREIVYGARQLVQYSRDVKFGAYQIGDETYGADVTSPRKKTAKTPTKAIQYKVVSTGDQGNVAVAITRAAKQLAGVTEESKGPVKAKEKEKSKETKKAEGKKKSNETPRPTDQRIVTVVVCHEKNPYPWTGDQKDFGQVTRAEIEQQFLTRLQGSKTSGRSFDKIKLEYVPPRQIKGGAVVRTVTIVRRGKGRGEDNLLKNAYVFGGKPEKAADPGSVAPPEVQVDTTSSSSTKTKRTKASQT